MLVLFETALGYAIFKLVNEKCLQKSENLYQDFKDSEQANKIIKLKQFVKFDDTTEALAAATSLVEGKMSKTLKKLLKKLVANNIHEQMAVADAKLGGLIREKFHIPCVSNMAVQELMRCIRSQIDSLLGNVSAQEFSSMALGLAHSLSRYKLKFSPDKIDTMIIQAISLLDDLDKELNNYIMRCKEWYGWHFPELSHILSDGISYVRTVKAIGMRTNAADADLSFLPESQQEDLQELAEVSMGTEISDIDLIHILHLCDQVIEMSTYRAELYNYLTNRMMAIAPNLTILVGDLVAARLISHAGSLLSLAKHPASTVQILGAEKALFRALKARHDTPKYGLIYHAQLIGQSSTRVKGKASRMLAAKAALASRVDALGDETSCALGQEHRAKLEWRLKQLEDGVINRISGLGGHVAKLEKYIPSMDAVDIYPHSIDNTILSKRKASEKIIPAHIKKAKLENEGTPAVDSLCPSNMTNIANTSQQIKKKRKKKKISNIEAVAQDELGKEDNHKQWKKKRLTI